MTNRQNTLNTYMSFVFPVDPARATISSDADLSYSLCERIIDFDPAKNLIGGIAKSWEFTNSSSVVFILKDMNWSDGSPLHADDVIRSMNRTKRVHGKNLSAFFNLLKNAEALGPRKFSLHFNKPINESDVLMRLTEFMYGVSWVDKNGELDLSKTLGPYFMSSSSDEGITLIANKYSWRYSEDIYPVIEIKSSSLVDDPISEFLNEDWSMIQSTSSLVASGSEIAQRKDIEVIDLDLTRTFFLTPNPQLAEKSHYTLLKYLRSSINKVKLLEGLSGYQTTTELFPVGSQLNANKTMPIESGKMVDHSWESPTLKILILEERVPKKLRENLVREITTLTGKRVELIAVPLSDFSRSFSGLDFDFYFGCIGVEDPNPAGVLSWLIETQSPIISSHKNNFKAKLVEARKLATHLERTRAMANILHDAAADGHILPFFHYTISILTKPAVHATGNQITDEVMNFAQVKRRQRIGS